MLGGIHILEEGIGEFADLGVVHLVIFMIEILLHDPLVALLAMRLPSGSNAATMCLASMVLSVNAVLSSERRMP